MFSLFFMTSLPCIKVFDGYRGRGSQLISFVFLDKENENMRVGPSQGAHEPPPKHKQWGYEEKV